MAIRPGTALALVALVALFACPASGEDVERSRRVILPPDEPAEKEQEKATGETPPLAPTDTAGPRRLMLLPYVGKPPPAPPPVEEPKVLSEAERIKGRIDGYFQDIQARRRVETGRVHSNWHELARRMEYFWEPEFDMVHDERIAEVSWKWFADSVFKAIRRGYRTDGKDPFLRPELEPGDAAHRAWTGMLDWQRIDANDPESGNRVVALVEVRIGSAGETSSRLHTSSGHPSFDRAAMEAVAKAIEHPFDEQKPPGPARSLYEVAARYYIFPPLPVVGFGFDIMLGYFETMYPLKKQVNGQVRLVAVYPGG
jgi:hypothetical protein